MTTTTKDRKGTKPPDNGEGLTDQDKAALQAHADKAAAPGPEKQKKTKRERFVELCPSRVNKAAKALAAVGRCGARSCYDYTDVEALAVLDYLSAALADVKRAFAGEKKDNGGFKIG